jgi:hypothetical protein
MLRVFFFPWVLAGLLAAIIILDVALMWDLFAHPNSPTWLMSFRWPFSPG